jgi:multidrug efflux pump subunit AcrA (membrane-fusion protein)
VTRSTILLFALAMFVAAVSASNACAQITGFLDEAKLEKPRQEIKIFHLEHADASSIAEIVTQLFGVTAVVDPRLNALIVRDPSPEALAELEAVIARLDQPAPKRPVQAGSDDDSSGDEHDMGGGATGAGAADDGFGLGFSNSGEFGLGFGALGIFPGPKAVAAEIQQAAQTARQAELKAAQLARQYRQAMESGSDDKQLDAERARLRAEIVKAFEAKQRVQFMELTALGQRLRQIEDTVKARETIKQRIIDRRLEELLDPKLRWESMPATTGLPGAATAAAGDYPWTPETGAGTSSEPLPATAVFPDSASGGAIFPPSGGTPFPAPARVSAFAPSATIDNVDILQVKLEAAEAYRERLKAAYEAGQATIVEAEQAAIAVRLAEAELAAAQRRYEAESKLLESELHLAEANLVQATAEFERIEQLVEKKVVSATERDRLKAALDKARIEYERAKTLLELHRGAPRSTVPQVHRDNPDPATPQGASSNKPATTPDGSGEEGSSGDSATAEDGDNTHS